MVLFDFMDKKKLDGVAYSSLVAVAQTFLRVVF